MKKGSLTIKDLLSFFKKWLVLAIIGGILGYYGSNFLPSRYESTMTFNISIVGNFTPLETKTYYSVAIDDFGLILTQNLFKDKMLEVSPNIDINNFIKNVNLTEDFNNKCVKVDYISKSPYQMIDNLNTFTKVAIPLVGQLGYNMTITPTTITNPIEVGYPTYYKWIFVGIGIFVGIILGAFLDMILELVFKSNGGKK